MASLHVKSAVRRRVGFFLGALALLLLPQAVQAQSVEVTPITWNIIGLDSNDVNAGPNRFPIGARVCATGALTNVVADFVWDVADPEGFINLRAGSNDPINLGSLADGECKDAYFEVEITRNVGAYDNTASYHIGVTADGGVTGSTPTPRIIIVEHLISQSRNSILDIQYGTDGIVYDSVASGGTMTLEVGETYFIKLVASTATQGYEQLESFVNFPNTVFQILSVETTYSADSSPNVSSPDDKLYADGCTWENDPNSPNYLSCLGVGKAGGSIEVVYEVTILSLPSVNPEPLNSLVHDFSGSSFHYNADYDTSARFAEIVSPLGLLFTKAFSPGTTSADGTSTLTFTIKNPFSLPFSNIDFDDFFPPNMQVASPTGAGFSGCGAGAFSPVPSPTDTSISVTGASVAAFGTCLVTVTVTPTVGDVLPGEEYINTSGTLIVDGEDTGLMATATLRAVNGVVPPPVCGYEVATWDMTPGVPFENTNPPGYTTKSAFASTADAAFVGTGGTSAIYTGVGSPVNSWGADGWQEPATGYPNAGAAPYFEFTVDTSTFSTVYFDFNFWLEDNWANSANNTIYIYSAADNGAFTLLNGPSGTSGFAKSIWYAPIAPFEAAATGSSTTSFRINIVGAKKLTNSALVLDNVMITGCKIPLTPAITKVFSPDPIATNGISTLTFTLSNYEEIPLTGVTFTDPLPTGMQVAATPNASTTCGGTPTWAPGAGATTLTFGAPTGAVLSAVAVGSGGLAGTPTTCTVQVDVTATVPGVLPNFSDFIFSTESLSNTTATGSAFDTLTVVAGPEITKAFAPNPILVGQTSTLTFNITNPNPTTDLVSVAFTDTYPANLVNESPANALVTNCTGASLTANDGGSFISISGVSLPAGETCTVTVEVTSAVVADYLNSVTVTHLFNGATTDGGTATDTLDVNAASPGLSFSKQIGLSASGPWFTTVAVPPAPTGKVWYRFIVENTGDVEITAISVSDPQIDGEEACTFRNPLPVADADEDHIDFCVVGGVNGIDVTADSLTNTASASGSTIAGAVTSNSDSATYETIELSIVKSVVQHYFTGVGQVVDYQFVVTNTGVATFSGALGTLDISDDKTANDICQPFSTAVPNGDNFLQQGESVLCSASYTITADDVTAGEVLNTAFASFGGVSSAEDDALIGKADANFGHLPTASVTNPYLSNTFNADGARHLTGSTYLGAGAPVEVDGTDGAFVFDPAFDDGVTWSPSATWMYGTVGANFGGSIDATVVCPSGPCYLAGWIDWNNDGDFDDASEQISGTAWEVNDGANLNLEFDIPGGTAGSNVNGAFYIRFRLYEEDPGATLSPYGEATNAAGTAATVGEVEDYFWTVTNGVTTPVTIGYFNARLQGHGTAIEWSTATESANFGFNLYAIENGVRVRLNEELIQSRATDSLDRIDYSFHAPRAGSEFLIEEVGILGETRVHGPFGAGEVHGHRSNVEKIDWGAIRFDMQAVASIRSSNAKGGGPSLSLGLTLNKTGIYRLTYERLLQAGVDLRGTPKTHLAITNRGEPVPVHVEANGLFGPGAYIEFEGQAIDTIYTDTNYYSLIVDQGVSIHMPVNNALPGAGLKPALSYDETTLVHRQKAYARYAPGTDTWYDTSMVTNKTPKSWDFPFEVTALADPGAAGTLDLVVWGVTDFAKSPDHHLLVSVNGTRIGDEWFDGLIEKHLLLSIPAAVLREGANTLQLTLAGDTGNAGDVVNLDKFSVTYPRSFQARDGLLTFTAVGKAFKVTNLPSSKVSVYRVNGAERVRMRALVEPGPANTYAATFSGSAQSATYYVSTDEWVLTPAMTPTRTPGDLDVDAEYLVIAHPSFISGIQPLVQARRARGLTVNVVDVNDLYAKYTFGVFDPAAITQYVSYAARELGTRFVLLVGGDTYDYRNYLGRNSISFIPSLYATTISVSKFVPVDPKYGDLDGDNVPDIAIGRFPARTVAELDLLVKKTLDYENKTYRRTAFFASDKIDQESFRSINSTLIAGMPAGWAVERTDLDTTAVVPARESLTAAMNRGTSLVTFTGHSGPAEWTFSGLFRLANAAALTNAGKPFVVVQWGCWNTYYVDPVNNYLVQSFLFSGDKGAAAVLGASTLTTSRSERMLGMELTPRMATAGTPIGTALLEAKKMLPKDDPRLLDVLLGWTLMGDPALVVEP